MGDQRSSPWVLLADDDLIMRRVLSEFFAREGWKCDIASDGHQAIEAAVNHEYDLIVTDLVMPGLHGMALLSKLREVTPSLPIVIVSGSADFDEAAGFLKDGFAVDYIHKPVDIEILANAVDRVVGGARQRDFEKRLLAHVTEQKTSFEFTTRELAAVKFPLMIADQLLALGVIDNSTRLRLELAFQEAVANAVEHGNLELASAWKDEFDAGGVDKFSKLKKERLRDDKFANRKVFLELTYDKHSLQILVRDEGQGFTPRAPAEVNVAQETDVAVHGRGVSIIYGVMDQVEYSHGGRQLLMTKNLSQ